MVGSRTIDRKAPKTYLTIRACAELILKHMHEHTAVELKIYNSATIREAYKLLLFERLIRRQNDYSLTDVGAQHISKKGFTIYNQWKG